MEPTSEELLPSALRQWIYKGTCVAIVGTGFSMPLGFPSWQGLLENLLQYARENAFSTDRVGSLDNAHTQIACGQLVAAAGELKRLLTPAEFSVFLNQEFSTSRRENAASDEVKERMRARRQSLVTTPWAGIVTTNFDNVIESDKFNWRANGTDPDLGHILSRREPFLVKIHSGNWQSEGVFTSEDYYETYLSHGRSAGPREFLKAVTLTHQVVFVGSSLEDRLLDIRREMLHAFRGYLPGAWALVPDTPFNRAKKDQMLQDHQIKLILYPPDIAGRPAHWCVDEFLRLTSECMPSRL